MNASKLCRRLSLLASTVVLALASSAALAQPQIDRLVFFGASVSDTGNAFVFLSDPANQGKGCGVPQNVPPYDALDDLLVPDGPYARGGHHFTNGATWTEGVARALGLAGNARPALANAGTAASNYAAGGARAVPHDDFVAACRFNLPNQVAAYLAGSQPLSDRSLIAMEIGGNDVRDALVAAFGNQDPVPVIQSALTSVGGSVMTLYARGARRFVLLNVGDPGKTPAVQMLGPQAVAGARALASQYNFFLSGVRLQLMQALPGSDIRIVDVFDLLDRLVASPGSYGLANVADACVTPNQPPFRCARPDTYLWWDGLHPTKVVHEIVAREVMTTISAP
jgi:phospholipase/lecithinase/hemolysin